MKLFFLCVDIGKFSDEIYLFHSRYHISEININLTLSFSVMQVFSPSLRYDKLCIYNQITKIHYKTDLFFKLKK